MTEMVQYGVGTIGTKAKLLLEHLSTRKVRYIIEWDEWQFVRGLVRSREEQQFFSSTNYRVTGL
jgi:hypothetical protein